MILFIAGERNTALPKKLPRENFAQIYRSTINVTCYSLGLKSRADFSFLTLEGGTKYFDLLITMRCRPGISFKLQQEDLSLLNYENKSIGTEKKCISYVHFSRHLGGTSKMAS